MEKKAYPLGNKGMLRDTSISKRDNEHAYENFNIRITANDKETLLSVTNERGHVISSHIAITNGYYLGHCVIENYVVLFVTDDKGEDRIIRCEFNSDGTFKHRDVLFSGTLNLDKGHPIETLGQVETNQVKKVYWVDGKNLTRVINICNLNQGPQSERDPEYGKPYFGFDFIPTVKRVSDSQGNEYNINCTITKSYDGSGYMKPGTIQYFLTLYHKMGTETAVVWSSPLQYSSFEDRGASPEETTPSKFTFDFTFLDGSFDYARLYAYGRSSENTSAFAYIIDDYKLVQDENGYYTAHFVDNGADNTDIDPNQILFLGGQEFIASTLTDKNGKLFLGNLKYPEAEGAEEIGNAIKENCFDFGNDTSFVEGKTYKAKYKDGYGVWFLPFDRSHKDSDNIAYPYTIDLDNGTNGETNIKGFKRGNKYRFGVQFVKNNGSLSRTFWIGDAIAETTASIDYNKNLMVAMCHLPDEVVSKAKEFGYTQYRLMYVKPSASDRLVLSQGVVNPSVFNINERARNRIYAQSSWVTRPVNGPLPNKHLAALNSSDTRYGEIQNLVYDSSDVTEIPSVIPSVDKISPSRLAYRMYSEGKYQFLGKDYMKLVLEVGHVDDGFKPEKIYTTDWFQVTAFQNAPQKKATDHKDEAISKFSAVFNDYPLMQGLFELDGFVGILCWDANNMIASRAEWKGKSIIRRYVYAALKDGDFIYKLGGETEQGDENWNKLRDGFYYEISNNIKSLFDTYIKNHKNAYFIDESILSFNSPDLGNIVINKDLYKFRLIGLSEAINNTFSFDIDIKTSAYSINAGKAVVDSVWKYSNGNSAIVNAPLFYGTTHALGYKDIAHPEKGVVDTVDTMSKIPYYIYMWHTSTSIENYKNDEIIYSDIDKKIFYNRYYGSDTRYFSKYYDLELNDIKNTFGNSLVNINSNNGVIAFAGNVDTVLNNNIKKAWKYSQHKQTDDTTFEYKVFTGQDDIQWTYDTNEDASTGGNSTSVSLMRYQSSPQAVVSINGILPALTESKINQTSTIFNSLDADYFMVAYLGNNGIEAFSAEYQDEDGFFEIEKNVYDILKKELNITIISPIYDINGTTSPYVIQKGGEIFFDLKEDTTNNKYLFKLQDNSTIEKITDESNIFSFADDKIYVYTKKTGSFVEDISSEDDVIIEGIQEFSTNTYYLSPNYGDKKLRAIQALEDWADIDLKQAKAYAEMDEFVIKTTSPITDEVKNYFNINDVTTTPAIENPYLYIAEIYRDEDIQSDFGGISQSALNNNTYYPCSMYDQLDDYVDSTDGDTYYQRYDCLRVMPYSDSDVNQVVDICSVMLETYTNLDGRYDTKRYTNDLLTIDWNNFAPINYAYSSDNNVITGSVLDDRYQNGDYSSSIVHSLVKEPNSLVDTWSNITLASIVGLDSDKGPVNKLTKYSNNIYAFQDKAIEQILYDERTQITPSIGVPIEIANSATVSHHMITDMYGSKHKRSIVTAKSGLYFYDYNNGVICSFGEGVQPISTTKGFDTWVREHSDFEGFYDKRHGDIYFLTTSAGSTDYDTLCYNEYLGEFTSFYQYNKPNFMFNLYDHWMSYKDRKYWINNEGEYGNIYDNQQDSLIEYKITPDPYGDKLFTNINYRTDFFDGDTYQEKKTFSHIRAYNEYQDTGDIEIVPVLGASYMPYKKGEVKSFKKFRIWNMDIPRVESSKMDRIRNPWVQIVLQTDYTPLRYEFHNANVIYYE